MKFIKKEGFTIFHETFTVHVMQKWGISTWTEKSVLHFLGGAIFENDYMVTKCSTKFQPKDIMNKCTVNNYIISREMKPSENEANFNEQYTFKLYSE